MPLFKYKARNKSGELVEGKLEGNTIDAVASQLTGSGIIPISIIDVPDEADTEQSINDVFKRKSVEDIEIIVFTRQLYSLVKAGVPIIRGLTGLAESARSEVMQETLNGVVRTLESGRELSSALAEYPDVFAPIVISTVRVGENSGRLDESLMRLSHYLQRDKETRERIKSALRYPTMVLGAISIAIGIINVWVIPAFTGIFERSDVELPWATKILIATSNFAVNYWLHILIVLIAALSGFKYWIKTEDGHYRWDRYKYHMPVIGNIIQQASLARFSRGFAMSLRSGVPLIQGLTVVAKAVDNAYLSVHILSMRSGIERGDTLTRTAAGTGLFTPLVLQMLGVGEETGQIDDMLDEVAEFYEQDVDYAIANLGAAIEPILLVAIGIMVLILALGVFLPMWDLASTFR